MDVAGAKIADLELIPKVVAASSKNIAREQVAWVERTGWDDAVSSTLVIYQEYSVMHEFRYII